MYLHNDYSLKHSYVTFYLSSLRGHVAKAALMSSVPSLMVKTDTKEVLVAQQKIIAAQ